MLGESLIETIIFNLLFNLYKKNQNIYIKKTNLVIHQKEISVNN